MEGFAGIFRGCCLEVAEADIDPKEREGKDEGWCRGEEKVPD